MEKISREGYQFLERFEQLSESMQKAALIFMENMDAIWEICDASVLTLEERNRLQNMANEQDDPLLLLMVALESQLNV